jgi:hypothetical protein
MWLDRPLTFLMDLHVLSAVVAAAVVAAGAGREAVVAGRAGAGAAGGAGGSCVNCTAAIDPEVRHCCDCWVPDPHFNQHLPWSRLVLVLQLP